MKYIAHRGLLDGPAPELENTPEVILNAINLGFDAEIDVRLINGEWWLGHDGPQYRVPETFLYTDGLWIHAKNLDALYALTRFRRVACFWHDADEHVLTSNGIIWSYPGKPLTDLSVCVQPEWEEDWRVTVGELECYGVCSKYARAIKEIREDANFKRVMMKMRGALGRDHDLEF